MLWSVAYRGSTHWGGGGAPSGKVCVVTSVASFLVLGGGGARPPNVPTKMYIYCASERSERAPQKHIFSGLKIHLPTYIQSMHFPLLMVWRYKRYYTDKTLKLRKKSMSMNMRASGASELRKFSHIFTC